MKKALINYSKQKNKNDERYTPDYGVTPILKYLIPNSLILCPFDKEDSAFVQILRKSGHTVISTHIDNDGFNQDFFKLTEYSVIHDLTLKDWNGNIEKNYICVEDVDYIISNPPYSVKNKVLEKLYELGKPFAMLLPLTTLESKYRGSLFRKYGIELLVIDKRIEYLRENNVWFNSSYFCWNILPEKLIFHELVSG